MSATLALDLAPGGHSVSYPRSEFRTKRRGSRYSGPTTKTPLSAVTGSGANTERVGPVRRLNVEHAGMSLVGRPRLRRASGRVP